MNGRTQQALIEPGEAPDRALVDAFLEGDERAFRTLYRRHTPRIRMLALRLTGAEDRAAEDVVQEAWIRGCQSLDAFEWRSSLSTWLCGITIRCAFESGRSRDRRVQRERVAADLDRASSGYGDAGPDIGHARASGIDLDRALARLPDRQRFVLVLHDVEGYTHREIAQRLGIAEGTSKSDLSHGRRALRSLLGWERYA